MKKDVAMLTLKSVAQIFIVVSSVGLPDLERDKKTFGDVINIYWDWRLNYLWQTTKSLIL